MELVLGVRKDILWEVIDSVVLGLILIVLLFRPLECARLVLKDIILMDFVGLFPRVVYQWEPTNSATTASSLSSSRQTTKRGGKCDCSQTSSAAAKAE